jgi:hypothetical protein
VLGGINVVAHDGAFVEFIAMPDPFAPIWASAGRI